LQKIVEEQMQTEYNQVSRMRLKRALLDILDDEHDFEVPAGMLDLEFSSIRQQIAMERQDQLNKDGALELEKDEEEELQAIAGRRVRLGMILSEVGRKNNIRVMDQELQQAVINEARRYPGQEAQVFEYYKNTPAAIEAMRAPVFEDKVVDFIIEMADVTEKIVTFEELTAEDEDDSYVGKKKGKSSTAKKSPTRKKADSGDQKETEGESAPVKKAPAKKTAAKKKAS